MIEYFLAWWGLGLFMGFMFGRAIFRQKKVESRRKIDQPMIVASPGLIATMVGWFDHDNELHHWIDENPEGRQHLSFQRLDIYQMFEDGSIYYTQKPYLTTMISDCGHWFGIIEPGKYHFVYSRYDGEVFRVTRKVG